MNSTNYQILAQAIVFKAIEDAQGKNEQEAEQARQWLAQQGVIELDRGILDMLPVPMPPMVNEKAVM